MSDARSVLHAELRNAARSAGLPVVFGGEVVDGRLRLSGFVGTRTSALHDLAILPGAGLGGRVLMQGHPIAVNDYGSARTITHDYDRPVLAEGLSSIIAVPVRTGDRCRGVVYGAVRRTVTFGDRVRDALMTSGRRLARELSARDELGSRVALADALSLGASREELRSVHSELRAIAGALPDPEARRRIYAAAQRLVDLGEAKPVSQPRVRLSTRETDVLAQVALGCTNAEVADRLSLSRETVKAYLQSVMRKLDAHTRHEAVVKARRLMLLP
ncbi:LuxR C-terminal-related transcriptional regulator [Amycolatopsis thermophila]|uniref:DNA-binding CsgD family transcriptional regulator n=1 Tax=Amycolatopsis thermophila TaxID=206084 RepID=A0ABU0F6C6_9PSEU|nr:LuxR C-terminal-related transcriptional regulator [Amycolatopsis thermophila]MDQ0383141.1 DNA-binding CsgD family transcriptional regulator [Amycolatopsis thermophila]